MLKLPFIYQFQQVRTATIGNKEAGVLEIPKLVCEQIKTLFNFCTETVKMTCAIPDETEIRLLNVYNSLTNFEFEDLDSHRGSGRIENRSRAVKVFFSIVKNELMPEWVIA